MICIILAAQERDKKFRNIFSQLIASHFSTVCVFEKQLQAVGEHADFLITDVQSCECVQADSAVIVYRDALHVPPKLFACEQAAAVVDSCNKEVFAAAGASGLEAITCGLSAKDTLTLSSTGVDSTVLNLQRSVPCFDGSVAEPQEIPLRAQVDTDSFTLMAASALFILSGNTPRLFEGIF